MYSVCGIHSEYIKYILNPEILNSLKAFTVVLGPSPGSEPCKARLHRLNESGRICV